MSERYGTSVEERRRRGDGRREGKRISGQLSRGFRDNICNGNQRGSALIAAYYTLLATFGFVQLQPFMHALALAGKASRTHRSVSQQLYGGVFYFYSLQDAPGFAIV